MRTPAPLAPHQDPTLQSWKGLLESDAPVASKTAAYTATSLDDWVLADSTGGAFAVTLPLASRNKGKQLTVTRVNAGVNAVTVALAAGDSLVGASATLGSQYSSRTVRSNGGVLWYVIASI